MSSAVKVFGVTYGPGTRVVEESGAAVYQPATLGGAVFIGPFARGMVSTAASRKLNRCPTRLKFARKMGGRLSGYVTPDAAQDFWEYGGGAGAVYAVRLTDGTEEQSEVILYSRHWGTAFYAPNSERDLQSQVKIPVLKVQAKNGGRWGGRRRVLNATVGSSGSIAATALTTGVTMLENEFAGATLTFAGITGVSYEVVSNTTAGVVTVKSDANMAADYAASGTLSLRYNLSLANRTLATGGKEALALKVGPGVVDAANNFSLQVFVDGSLVKTFDDLSMDPSSSYYVSNVVDAANQAEDNDEIEVTDLISSSGYTYVPDLRPANFYAMPKTVTATRATFVPGSVVSVTDTAKVKVVSITGTTVPAVPHRLTFTWTSSNLYTVVATERANGVVLKNLPDFSVGSSAQYNIEYDPGALPTVKIKVDHTSEPADGDTIVIDVLPVEAAMVKGDLYPDAKGSTSSKLLVTGVATDGSNYVDITTGDLTVLGLTPVQATVTGTNAQTFNIGSGSSDTLKLNIDKRGSVTVTLTAGGTRTAANIVADINGAFDAIYGAGVLNPASATSDNKVKLTSTWYEGGGAGSSIALEAVANDAYTVLGFTEGNVYYGTDGKEMMVAYAQECSGGHDGGAPTDAKYLDAMAADLSPLNLLNGRGAGQLMLATPDKTATAVQQRGQAFADERAFMYFVQIPSSTTTEQGAVDYIETTIGYGDMSTTFFPSYGYVTDPDKQGPLKLVPLCGAIMGMMAKKAGVLGHYSEPPAGLDAVLHRVVKLPTGEVPVDFEQLTPRRINSIKRVPSGWVVWGSSALARSSTSVQDWSVRCQVNHYVRWALENLDWILFRLHDEDLRLDAKSFVSNFFRGEWKGGKGPLLGATPEKAYAVKIDDENNTPGSVAARDFNIRVDLALKKVVNRVIFTLGRDGVIEA